MRQQPIIGFATVAIIGAFGWPNPEPAIAQGYTDAYDAIPKCITNIDQVIYENRCPIGYNIVVADTRPMQIQYHAVGIRSGEIIRFPTPESLFFACPAGQKIFYVGPARGYYGCNVTAQHMIRGSVAQVYKEALPNQKQATKPKLGTSFVSCIARSDAYNARVWVSGISSRDVKANAHQEGKVFWSKVRLAWINYLDRSFGKAQRGVECVVSGKVGDPQFHIDRTKRTFKARVIDTKWSYSGS